MKIQKILLFVLMFITLWQTDIISKNKITWKEIKSIPAGGDYNKQHGLAAPFVGESNGVILVAGGANFPANPVTKGGTKVYHNDIFMLQPDEDEYKWKSVGKFPFRVAYGVAVNTKHGIICIGGESKSCASSRVIQMVWNKLLKKVEFTELTNLPYTISNMSGDIHDDNIYIAGGYVNGKASNKLFKLDISANDIKRQKWIELAPFPGAPRTQPVVKSQNSGDFDLLYIFGGASFDTDSTTPDIMTDALEYSFERNEWNKSSEIITKTGEKYCFVGASAIKIGAHHILFVGGVNKNRYSEALVNSRELSNAYVKNKQECADSIKLRIHEYLSQPVEFYKFNRDILLFHTITKSWTINDKYPKPGPAGAPIVKYDEGFLIINGETKPGVRTDRVMYGSFSKETKFGILNYIVLIIYLLGMLYLGYYFMKRSKSTDDYFRAGGRIPWWAAGISIFATTLSAITFMSIPAKTYISDWRYFAMAVTILTVAPFIIRFYLPFIRKLNITSAYEYLEKRFNVEIRALAAFLFAIFMVSRIAIVLFLPSIALATVTGINVYTCIVLMGVITIIYSTAGGVEAVVWGDVIQGFVLVGGALISILFLVIGTDNGITGVMDIAMDANKLKTLDYSLDPTQPVLWVVLIGGFALNVITYTSDQSVVQRYITTASSKDAIKSIWLNGIIAIPVSAIFYFIGTALFTFYKSNPDNLNVMMQNNDAIFPEFIMGQLPMGIAGILIAAIFSATMSTLSSNVNSVATVFTTDFFRRFNNDTTDKQCLRVAKITSILVGLVGMFLAILLATWEVKSLFDHFNTILGLFSSGIGGLFIMGIFFKRISSIGAISGVIASVVTLAYVKFYTDLNFLLYGLIGILSCIIFGYIVSIFKPQKDVTKSLTI